MHEQAHRTSRWRSPLDALVHAGGMTLKYRLASQSGPPAWWERVLFWLCWACLAGLSGWLAVSATD